MRIASLLIENDLSNEERKKSIHQRKVNDTYKKNASYVQASQNQMFEALESLLSGKTEKEVHEKSLPSLEQMENKVGQERSIAAPVSSNPESEHVEKAYFPPNSILSQTIQSAENATAEIQQPTTQVRSEESDFTDEEGVVPFANEPIDVFIPERFNKNFTRMASEETVFGKNLERQLFERTFNKAKKSYSFHMQMAQSGFAIEQPKFSLTA